MDVNFLGPYMVSQNFMPILAKEAVQRGWADRPCIVMVGSFGGKVRGRYGITALRHYTTTRDDDDDDDNTTQHHVIIYHRRPSHLELELDT